MEVFVARHGLAQLLLWSCFYYLPPALVPALAGAGIGAEGVSAAIGAAFIVWAVALPLAGHLIDRGMGAQMMRAGAALGVGLVLVAAVAPVQIAGAALVLLGLAMAATLYDPCFALIMRTPGLDAGKAITQVTLIAGLATLLTFPVVAGLGSILPWRGIVLIFAALGVLGVLLLPRTREVGGSHGQPDMSKQAPSLREVRHIFTVAVPFGLAIFSHVAIIWLLPVSLMDLGEQGAGVLLLPAILGPAQIAGRLAWHKFASGLSPRFAVLMLFALFLGPPAILLASQGSWALTLLALVLQGGLYGIHTVIRPIAARSVLPAQSFGRSLGIIAMIGIFFMAAGPGLGAAIWGRWGYDGLVLSLAAVNSAALMLAWYFHSLAGRSVSWKVS